jgi:hypothetical protein
MYIGELSQPHKSRLAGKDWRGVHRLCDIPGDRFQDYSRQPDDHYNGRAGTPLSVAHDDVDARSR